MKTAGIILLVLQAIGLIGGLIGQSLPTSLPGLIGYFLCGIIGIILICKAKSKENKENNQE